MAYSVLSRCRSQRNPTDYCTLSFIIHSDADQICYAVLCVFSYFAAGQEQKKAILEQAAQIHAPEATAPVSPRLEDDVFQTKASPQNNKRPSEIRVNDAERQRVPPDKPRVLPERPKRLPEQPSARETPGDEDSGLKEKQSSRRESEDSTERTESRPPAQRTESLPPRRPPPPALPPQRLTRAYSQASPPRHHDPPTIPPRVGASPRAGAPPALPPRQMSAAADISTSPRSSVTSSPVRRGGLSRQSSISATPASPASNAPFATTNPFTAPRHAEFVIPQRSTTRRPSTDRNS